MKVRFKKLTPKAVMPTKAHPTDAGFDLTAISYELDECGNVVYHTGIATEIPEGHAGFLFPRSSICKKDLVLTDSIGLIDSHYRGEITMKFKPVFRAESVGDFQYNHETEYYLVRDLEQNIFCFNHYHPGDRIGQLVIVPYPEIEFEEADELSETDRGTGGYGSTGN